LPLQDITIRLFEALRGGLRIVPLLLVVAATGVPEAAIARPTPAATPGPQSASAGAGQALEPGAGERAEDADAAFAAGDLPEALRIGRRILSQVPGHAPSEALRLAGILHEWCIRARDAECALEFDKAFFDSFKSLPQEERRSEGMARRFAAHVARSLRNGLALRSSSVVDIWLAELERFATGAPSLGDLEFVDINLAVAEAHVLKKDLDKASYHAERAWANYVVLDDLPPGQVLHFVPRFFAVFSALGQAQRAANLMLIARPVLAEAGRTSMYASLAYLAALRMAFAQTGQAGGAIDAATLALEVVPTVKLSTAAERAYRLAMEGFLMLDCSRAFFANCDRAVEIARRNAVTFEKRPVDDELVGTAIATAVTLLGRGERIPGRLQEALVSERLGRGFADDIDSRLVRAAGRFLHAVSVGERSASGFAAEAARSVIGRTRERIRRQPLDIAPIEGDEALVFSLAIAGSVLDPARDGLSDVELFELLGLVRKSGRSIDGQYLSMLADTANEMDAVALQSMHRLQQDYSLLERRLLGRQVDAALGRQSAGRSAEERVGLLQRLQDSAEQLHALRVALAPGAAGPSSSDGSALRSLQGVLSSDERYLTHTVASERLVTVCVGPNRIWKAATRPDFQALLRAIRLIQLALSNPSPPSPEVDGTFPVAEARLLTAAVLEPVADCLRGAKHVNFSLDAALAGVPPHVLLDPLAAGPQTTDATLASVPWFGLRYAVASISGSDQLVAARRLSHASAPRSRFLGVGDPALTGRTSDGQLRGEAVLRGVNRSAAPALAELGELPDTAEELRSLSTAFGDESTLLLKEGASELALRRLRLRDFGVIAFATHGLVREEIPGLSEPALVLTPVRTHWTADDGLLTATDIGRLDLAAELVILSACNSARFDLSLFGPEAASLSTAFFLAGARSTLASLWSVNSEATARLMAGFGRAYGRADVGASEALRRAIGDFVQGEADRGGEYRHPRFWAAFVVFGDGLGRGAETASRRSTERLVSLQQLSSNPGHLSSTVRVGDALLVAGARPVAGRSVYEGFYKRIDERGNTLWERADGERFPRLVASRSGERSYLVSFPNPDSDSGRAEVGYVTASGAVLSPYLLDVKRDEQPAHRPFEVAPGSVAIVSHLGVGRGPEERGERVRVVDLGKAEVGFTWEVPGPGSPFRVVKGTAGPDGSIHVVVVDKWFTEPRGRRPPTMFGLPHRCVHLVESSLYELDSRTGAVLEKWVYPDVEILDMQPLGRRRLAIVAQRYDGCGARPKDAAIGFWEDGKGSGFRPLDARGLPLVPHQLLVSDTDVIVLGSIARRQDSASLVSPAADPGEEEPAGLHVDPARSERIVSFIARFDRELNPTGVDLVMTGLDNYSEAAAATPAGWLVVGNTADRQMGFWAR
jgi:CHAT domain-containing protein